MICIESLNQAYGSSQILWDLNLTIPEGQITCLMGRNGVGKTTLAQCLMGHLSFEAQRCSYQDHDLTKLSIHQRAALGIGYVPQGRLIFPQLTIEENLRTGAHHLKGNSEEQLAYVYELFPVLKQMRNRQGGDLSGGQQQQLAIGRALMINPQLLILDEPTEGIQPNITQEISQILRQLNREQQLTVLLIEQKLSFIKATADRFAILERGQVVAQDEMTNLSTELIEQYLMI